MFQIPSSTRLRPMVILKVLLPTLALSMISWKTIQGSRTKRVDCGSGSNIIHWPTMSGLRVAGTCLLASCSKQARPPLLFCLAPSLSGHPAPLLIIWGRPLMKHHCRSHRHPQPLPPRPPCRWASLLLTWIWPPLYLQRHCPPPQRFPPPRLQLQVAPTETSDVGPVGSSKHRHVVQMPAGVTSPT